MNGGPGIALRRWLRGLFRQRGQCYCGYLDWTTATYGRITHKHGCPARRDRWCQSHPERCSS